MSGKDHFIDNAGDKGQPDNQGVEIMDFQSTSINEAPSKAQCSTDTFNEVKIINLSIFSAKIFLCKS
jgi:hypothetical protein